MTFGNQEGIARKENVFQLFPSFSDTNNIKYFKETPIEKAFIWLKQNINLIWMGGGIIYFSIILWPPN